jgi:hypothetical protein
MKAHYDNNKEKVCAKVNEYKMKNKETIAAKKGVKIM